MDKRGKGCSGPTRGKQAVNLKIQTWGYVNKCNVLHSRHCTINRVLSLLRL